MRSKIINMAERLKDSEDRALEALFRSEPVPDDGFSASVVSRVRRRLWVQRFTLPAALLVGALIAAKPLLQLGSLLPRLLAHMPKDMTSTIVSPIEGMFQGTTILLGIMLLGAILMIARMLEE